MCHSRTVTVQAQCVLPARRTSVAQAVDFVEDWCTRHGVGTEVTLRVALIVEELFTNTIVHGHRGDCDASVHLSVGVGTTEVTLEYEDEAPAFDPLTGARHAAAALDAPPDERPVGGLGLVLVARLGSRVDYARAQGRNRLRVTLERAR
jgi:anti-sigma regulatory factor (Ser/Thr protein kinase)